MYKIFHYQIPQAIEEPEIFSTPPDFHGCRFRSVRFLVLRQLIY